ncbi:uncharacterized protein LOC143286173 isoform X2 [Babylonia areolata]|uniref:uncharacterized protein LOC143286173 isoform X2 n=1 Tax=Babylonia areolata TaxID=304850 RepID=UPI003FD05ED8
MATPSVCYPWVSPETFPVWGLSTKGLTFDDPFAKQIAPDFTDLVDPKKLVMFLPPDLLTLADEDRVVARQDSCGREEAAKLLLSLMCRRGDWIPRLLQGLRHREIRLGHLADKIESMQGEVRMEVDFADDQLMEVDAEPWTSQPVDSEAHPHSSSQGAQPPPPLQAAQAAPTHPQAPPLQVSFPDLRIPPRMASGLGIGELPAPVPGQQRKDPGTILSEIAHHFFLNVVHSAEDLPIVTESFERIAKVLVTSYSLGCLEMRLRVDSARDLRQLRRLVESGVLQDTVQRALLTEGHRDWLREEAASHGLAWRSMKLKVTIERQDLDRCETFLKAREETANPRNAAEALLQKSGATQTGHVPSLPDLLLSFLDRLLQEHPRLAEKVALVLATTSSLQVRITKTMAVWRHHFGLSYQLHEDLGLVADDMLQNITRDGDGTASEETVTETQVAQELSVKAPPESPLSESVCRLIEAKLMMPHEAPDSEHSFRFVDVIVADFALTCIATFKETLPDDYVSRVFQAGSSFVVLFLVDLLLNESPHVEHLDTGFRTVTYAARVNKINMAIAEQLQLSMSIPSHPRAVTDFYLACATFFDVGDFRTLSQRCWWTFGPEWKSKLRRMLETDNTDALPDILLSPLSTEEMPVVRGTGEEVLSARHTMDLTEKLSNLSGPQLRVVLACAQMTNVADFKLVKVGDVAALREKQGEEKVTRPVSSYIGQPALKLCKNLLEERHIECLLEAMPGLESVPHFDLSFCTITHGNLQTLLDHMNMASVKTLLLNRVSFIDSRITMLPKFSHLKRLQAVELSSLGLQDSHMPQLAQQIRQLPDLRELTLEKNPITTDGLSMLAPALAPCASLRVLRLPECQLDAGGAFVLGASLMSAMCLQVLNLAHCPLLDSGLQHLSLVLRNHTLLSKVSLRDGGYSPAGLASFFSFLRKCPRMQHLELGQCPLEEEGIDVSDQFLRVLAGSCQWDFLGLWQCRIGHTTLLQQLGTLPTQLRSVTTLVLQDNSIDDAQVGHLAEAVQQGVFRHLRHLNLRHNNIREAGAKRLAGILSFLPHMCELLLQHSAIPTDGALSLAKSVLHLPDIQLLDLSDSFGMGHHDVIDVINDIETFVAEGGIVIGSGVGYTENDSSLEQQFITDNLQLLNFGGTRPGEAPIPPKPEGAEARPPVLQKPVEAEASPSVLQKPVEAEATPSVLQKSVEAEASPSVMQKPVEAEASPSVLQKSVEAEARLPVPEEAKIMPPVLPRPGQLTLTVLQKSVETEASPSILQKLVQAEASPTVLQKSVEAEASPSVLQKPVEAEARPPVLQKSVEAEASPSVLQKSVEAEASPSVMQKPVEAEASPSVLQKSVEAEARPPVPEEAKIMPPVLPRPEESAGTSRQVRVRAVSERHRDTLFFVDGLCISLGHQ